MLSTPVVFDVSTGNSNGSTKVTVVIWMLPWWDGIALVLDAQYQLGKSVLMHKLAHGPRQIRITRLIICTVVPFLLLQPLAVTHTHIYTCAVGYESRL